MTETTAAQTTPVDLTPLQLKTLALLRRAPDPVVFDQAFIATLRRDIDEAFDVFGERLGSTSIFISKHRLTSVLGCEVQHLLPDTFSWSPAVAGGQVAHRAIQLSINWRGDPVPAEASWSSLRGCLRSGWFRCALGGHPGGGCRIRVWSGVIEVEAGAVGDQPQAVRRSPRAIV